MKNAWMTSLSNSLRWILLIALIYFFSFGCVIGTMQGIADSRNQDSVPRLLAFFATVFSFPAFYCLPMLIGSPLRSALGDNVLILVCLVLNGLFWGAAIVSAFRLILLVRRGRAS